MDPAVLPVCDGDGLDDLLAWLRACQLTARRGAEHTRDASQLLYTRLREHALAAGLSPAQARDAARQVADPIGRGAAELARASAYLRLVSVRITADTAADDNHEPAAPTTKGPTVPLPATDPQPEPRRGSYHPDQPRGDDGRWIKVGDVLGYADDEVCYGTDRVAGTGAVTTDLALIEYPAEPNTQQGAFVSVATSPGQYNPVTGKETPRDPNESEHIYCAPQLDAGEAETLARHVEELAGLAESGYRPPEPTKHTRARQQLQHLISEKHAEHRDRIIVGQDEDFPLTAGDLLRLLEEADPTMSAVQTRRKVRARAASDAGGEDGTVWVDLEPDAAGVPRVVVTAVEGTGSPDDEYNRQYAAQHSPASARELAGKLRAFAGAARKRAR